MKQRISALLFVALFLTLASCFAVCAQNPEAKPYTVKFKGEQREFYLFVPDAVKRGETCPLIVCLHGYGGKAKGYRPEMAQAALENGYAICYPQGLKAPKGKTGWMVGYPKQEGMKDNDVDFIVYLAKYLPKQFGLDKDNVFMTGMSNGGEMCYIMALSHPRTFNAIASVAGLQMGWTIDGIKPRGTVPFFEIHGTGDKTSRWEGDPDNQYGWGAYLPVPAAVSNIVAMNKCRLYSVEQLPKLSEESNDVILHRYTRGDNGSEVLLYQVNGGTHSWALTDVDTCGEIIKFFESHRKR